MKHSLKNKILDVLNRCDDTNEEELLFCLKQIVQETELQTDVDTEPSTIKYLIGEALTEIKEELEGKNIIKSGFADFDDTYGGLGMGEYIILGGRPSMGKTQLWNG